MLYGKAFDARSTPSILGDQLAVQAVEKIDDPLTRVQKMMARRLAPNAALRSRHLDGWVRQFLTEHEQATVVHLGAGLDSRAWRVEPRLWRHLAASDGPTPDVPRRARPTTVNDVTCSRPLSGRNPWKPSAWPVPLP